MNVTDAPKRAVTDSRPTKPTVMNKTLPALCAALALTLTLGVMAQAAPLLPGEDELNGAPVYTLPGTSEEGEDVEGDTGPISSVETNEPSAPAETQEPVTVGSQPSNGSPAVLGVTETAGAENDSLKIAFNGVINSNVEPILLNEVTYVPFRAFCLETIVGAEVSWDAEEGKAICKSPSLEIEAPFGETYIIANGRVLFRYDFNIAINGTLYIPVRSLARAVGATVEWRPSEKCVNLTLTGTPITPASQFYNQDDLLWLARIINAESKYEPLLGKIAVGDVILNRVAHPDFPDTVYDVIFDDRYSIQFYPVTSPIIHNTPSEESIIAAKACLEGFSVSKTILYFMNPRLAVSNWISRNRSFVMTIGNHSFYA